MGKKSQKVMDEEIKLPEEDLLDDEEQLDDEDIPSDKELKKGVKLSKEEIKRLEKEINLMADQYYEARMKGNEDEMLNIRSMMLVPYLKRFDNFYNFSNYKMVESDFFFLVTDVFSKLLDKYDPFYKGKRRKFSNSISYILSRRKNDLFANRGNTFSLDANLFNDEQGKNTYYNIVKDSSLDVEEENKITQLVMLFIRKFCDELNGRDSTAKAKWFRLFLTEDMTGICKDFGKSSLLCSYSSDIFAVINVDYLDFYMSKICRNVSEIHDIPLKKNSEIGYLEGKGETLPDAEIKIPFDAYVSLLFLKMDLRKKSNRSNYFTPYNEFKDTLKESFS